MTDATLSRLLRLKRYEQPPPEYFENFLREFHRRQRADMMRRPAWRLALDRAESAVESFFGRFTLSQTAYGLASVAVLAVAGVMTLNLIQHPGTTTPTLALNSAPNTTNTIVVAQVAPPVTVAAMVPVRVQSEATAPAGLLAFQAEVGNNFTLDPRIRLPESDRPQAVRTGMTGRQPRYVLDARPVSYEPPFSF